MKLWKMTSVSISQSTVRQRRLPQRSSRIQSAFWSVRSNTKWVMLKWARARTKSARPGQPDQVPDGELPAAARGLRPAGAGGPDPLHHVAPPSRSGSRMM